MYNFRPGHQLFQEKRNESKIKVITVEFGKGEMKEGCGFLLFHSALLRNIHL